MWNSEFDGETVYVTSPDNLTFTLSDGVRAVHTTFKTPPRFHDQVLGGLIRKHWQMFPDTLIIVPADFVPVANAIRV